MKNILLVLLLLANAQYDWLSTPEAAKAGWQHVFMKTRLELYGGVDNILNEKYSLGDDLNAVGNRYYNPAPLRNYFVGLKVTI